MRNRLFNPDSALMITVTQMTDCIFLSLFFILCSFPLITVGASLAALYDASFRAFRQGEKNSWRRFWKVFRENLKPSLLPTLVFLPLLWALAKGAIGLWNAAAGGSLGWVAFSALAMLAVLGLGVLSVLFPLLSRFENSFGGLLKNTLLLSLANLPGALGLGLINAVSVFLCVRFVFPLFFLPSLAALLGSLLAEPMFRPFMPKEAPEESAEE